MLKSVSPCIGGFQEDSPLSTGSPASTGRYAHTSPNKTIAIAPATEMMQPSRKDRGRYE